MPLFTTDYIAPTRHLTHTSSCQKTCSTVPITIHTFTSNVIFKVFVNIERLPHPNNGVAKRKYKGGLGS